MTPLTVDAAISALRDLDATESGTNPEYARGASEALAYVLGMQNTGDSAAALLEVATNLGAN